MCLKTRKEGYRGKAQGETGKRDEELSSEGELEEASKRRSTDTPMTRTRRKRGRELAGIDSLEETHRCNISPNY